MGASDLEHLLFEFLCRKYVQASNERQKASGLQYMTAETHDLAAEVARFIEDHDNREGRNTPTAPNERELDDAHR
jgi:hypothetical protein